MKKPYNKIQQYEETHQSGCIILENLDMIRELTESKSLTDTSHILGDIGIQISGDGKIWVCINSIAFIRFKPDNKVKIEEIYNDTNVFDNEDKILSDKILKFLNKYGVKDANNPNDWNGPDASLLEEFANALVNSSKLFYPHSEWGSGCYKPYTSTEGKTKHDEILNLIYKRLHKYK